MTTTVASPVAGSSSRDGTLALEPYRTRSPSVMSGGAMGLKREVDAMVDDLPAGRLDLGAEPIGLGPVARGPCPRSLVGGGEHGVGDALAAGHPGRIARRMPGTVAASSDGSSIAGRIRSAYSATRWTGSTMRACASASMPAFAVRPRPADSHGPR